MTPADEAILAEFIERFGCIVPPRKFGNTSHCEECADANNRLMALGPDDLDAETLREPSKAWFFAWMGADGFRYFLPGLCRVVMEEPTRNLSILLDQLNPEWVAQLEALQKEALHDFLTYCKESGNASSDNERRELRSALERTQPV